MSPRTIIVEKWRRVWTSWTDIYFAPFLFVWEIFKGSSCRAGKLSRAQPPPGLPPLSYQSPFFSLPIFVCSRGVEDKGV